MGLRLAGIRSVQATSLPARPQVTNAPSLLERRVSAEARGEPLPSVLPVGLFRTDTEGRCLAVNARWCEITGLAPAEALDEGWARALHPDDRARVLDGWREATQ